MCGVTRENMIRNYFIRDSIGVAPMVDKIRKNRFVLIQSFYEEAVRMALEIKVEVEVSERKMEEEMDR